MVSNLQEGLAGLIKELEREGPNVRRVARSIGQNEATVRYWLREKLIKKGYVIQAIPGYEALGLRKIAAVVHVSKAHTQMVREVFTEMSESAYLSNYAGNLLDDSYLLVANVPTDLEDEFSKFMLRLKDIGLVTRVDAVLPFEWSRVLPMRVDSYDFGRSAWEFDPTKVPKPSEMKVRPAKKQKIDGTDLLIVMKLQVDARMTAKRMAASLGLDYKKVLRHHVHVVGRRLVSGYRLRWPGTKYDARAGRPRTTTHTYLGIDLMIEGISEEELAQLMYEIHRFPFLWFEAGGKNYFCEILIPLELANEVLLQLKRVTAPFEGRKRISIGDTGDALAFSISPELFNGKLKKWTFDPERSLRRIESILLTAKNIEV